MKLKDILIEDLSSLKSTSTITLHCDSCQEPIERIVKEVRRSIKNGKRQAFCSNTCQGKMLKINKTKKCEYCKVDFEYNFPTQQYCSVSCGNSARTHSDETKKKISNSLKGKTRSLVPTISLYRHTYNDFSTIKTCSCKHCGFTGSYRIQQLYCDNCKDMYYTGRSCYIFTFNIYNYPDLFDLDLINTVGWFNPTSKDLDGLSRDHRVSVNESIKNNYNPYYIKHPLNCEILPMRDNLHKHIGSSITYEELVRLVDEYESR